MKFAAKKVSKKVLSLLLVLCLVLTTMATTFSVFADEPTVFQVSYTAPAIPMYEQTETDLNNIEVQMTAGGSYVSGADITWSVAEGHSGVVLNSKTKKLAALSVGKHKLIARYGDTTKNVWVLVEKAGTTEFTLINYDFTTGIFNESEWAMYFHNAPGGTVDANGIPYYAYGATKYSGYSISSNGLYFGNGSGIDTDGDGANDNWPQTVTIVNKAEILKDFSDYTITANINGGTKNNTSQYGGIGFIARATLTDDSLLDIDYKYLNTLFGRTLGMILSVNRGTTTQFAVKTCDDELAATSQNTFSYDRTLFHDIKVIYSGKNQTATFGGYEIYSGDVSSKLGTYTENSGYVGLATTDQTGVTCKTFKVALNNNAMPAATEYVNTAYVVSTASPAIPMDALTVLSTENIMVETENGEFIGNTLTYNNVSGSDGIVINNTAKTITAYKKGNYKVEAFSGNVKVATLYVTVKNASDEKWVLYETDFTIGDSADFVGWSQQAKDSSTVAWTRNETLITDFSIITSLSDTRFNYVGTTDSGLPISDDAFNISWSSQGGVIVLDNEVVRNFSDYTITSDMYGMSGSHSNTTGFGIFGRVNMPTGDTATLGANMALKSVIYNFNGANNSTLVNNLSLNTANGNVTLSNNIKPYTAEGAKPIKMVYTFSGNTLSAKFGNGAVVTVSDMNTDKGVVGVYSGIYSNQYFAVAKTFSVALNNAADDKPVAEPLDIYTVQSTSPAIPMNSFTVLPFKNFAVATDTNTYLGDDLTYTNVSGKEGISIDNTAKTITAYKKGNYKIEAFSGDTKVATLYVTVKDSSDDYWYLYNTTFGDYSDVTNTYEETKSTTYDNPTDKNVTVKTTTTVNQNTFNKQIAFPTGWKSQIYSGGYKDYGYVQPYKFTFTTNTESVYADGSPTTSTPSTTTNRNATANGIVPFGNSNASISTNGWGCPAYFVLNDETVNAFADYTITSAMQSYNHQGWDVSERLAGNGIFGRAVIGADGGMSTTGSLQGFTAVNSTKKVRRYSLSNTTLSSSIIADGNSTQDWAYLSGKQTNNAPQSTPTEITLSVKFDGTTASFWSDKDTNKQKYTITDATVQKGAVGIMAGGTSENSITHVSYVNVRTFSVALNNAADDLPDATALQLYTVADNSPAIPMNVDTAVDTNNLIISLGGTNVHGADITYTPDETDGITIENGIITANAKGSYRVKIEADGETDYIWVVVKNRTDKEFVLYETDFSNEATLKEWQASFYDGTGTVKKWGAFPQGVNYFDAVSTLKNSKDNVYITSGWSPFTIENGVYAGTDAETSANVQGAWGQKAIFYSTHEIFKQFSDYTVNVDYWSNSSYHGGNAMLGRINLNDNNLVDTSSAATGMYINYRYSVNGNISGAEDVRANVFAFNGVIHTNLNQEKREYNFTEYAIGYPFRKYLPTTQRSIDLNERFNVTTKFDGENITMYSEGDTAGQVFTTTTGNTGKGSFGIGLSCATASGGSISQRLSVNSVKVTLNATDADLPPFTVTDGSYLVPVNTRLNLNTLPVSFGSKVVMGSDVDWTQQRNNVGQLLNNAYIAFSTGEATLTASYNGKTTTINVSVVENNASSNVAVEEVAGSDITIAPVGDKATQYKVTVTPPASKEVKQGTLVINDAGRTDAIITSADNTGLVYNLETALMDRAVLSVDYSDADNADLYSLGATVRIPTDEKSAGIRFGARSSAVRLSSTDSKVYLQDRTLEVDGTQYTLSKIGMVIIPEAIMGDELTVNTDQVAKKEVSTVIDDTSLYSDYVVTLALTDIDEQRGFTLAARPYMLYVDASGNEHYVYGDVITRSYDDVLDRTPSPDVITINNTDLSSYKIIVDNANANALYAANRINDYLLANTGYALDIVDDSVAATDYEIVIGETTRRANEITDENKYKGYSDGNKFYIFFGDEQAAEMAADDFCEKIIGKGNASYEAALASATQNKTDITMNVDITTVLTFEGQWDEIQRFALFADTHIGRYEKGTAWYAEYNGTNPREDYLNNNATYQAALQNSHGDLIKAFQHIAYLDSTIGLDYMTIVGDITETGYTYRVDDSKYSWEAYEFVLNKAFGGLDESASAYSVAINGLKENSNALPIYDVVGNHDTWNGSGTYEINSSNTAYYVTAPTDDTQFIRDRVWYSSDVNGKKIANISFNATYGTYHSISDADLAELEASLKAANKAGATQIIVYNHFAMYGFNGITASYYEEESHNKIAALLHKYGAQAYMSGHYHNEDWSVVNDGYTNYIDVDSTMNDVSRIYGGTYAVVTVTDRRIRYDIYSSTYTEASGVNSSDFATKTPLKTFTLNLYER